MNTSTDSSEDLSCYFVTKHSWKGKYKRIFSISRNGITTYNPSSIEVTNQWLFVDFVSIQPVNKNTSEFVITFRKPGTKKCDTMRFSTDHRNDVLTDALKFRHKFSDNYARNKRFNAYKHHWSDRRVPVILEPNGAGIDHYSTSSRFLCTYNYKDIEGIVLLSDYPGGFAIIYGGFNRLHLFASEHRDEFIKVVQATSSEQVGIGVRVRKDTITLDQFHLLRLGKYRSDEALTSCAEFTVHKVTVRSEDPVRRTLCLTEICILERDPATYQIVTCRPLSDIFAIVRNQARPQEFSLEYVKGETRTYRSTDRDALIASLLDGVRASGNLDVHVKMSYTKRGFRQGPFTVPVDEEVESQHMKFIITPPADMKFSQAIERFNSNISYNGLLHAVTADRLFAENKEKLICAALTALLDRELDFDIKRISPVSACDIEAELHAFRRLVASKAGFSCFTRLPRMRERLGTRIVKLLKLNNEGVSHASIDVLCALMQPMHADYDLKQEQLNKASLMSSKLFLQSLLEIFRIHCLRGTGALLIAAMLDFLTFALCAPYSETTDGGHFDVLLELVAADGKAIFKLFQHPSMAIVKGAGLLMKAIIEEGTAEIATRMQSLALSEGSLPRHLHTALFTSSQDNRMLTVRQLSRHLVGLWVADQPPAMAMLTRILPNGLLQYLNSDDKPSDSEVDRLHIRDNLKIASDDKQRHDQKNPHWLLVERQIEGLLVHWRTRIAGKNKPQQLPDRPIVLRKRRQRIKVEKNWRLFYWQFARDHARSDLIWNVKTRDELRNCIEDELRSFEVDRDLSNQAQIAWNHVEFEVTYRCLSDEIRIGNYYLRLLLEEDETNENSMIKQSVTFFNDLYHRFLTAKVSAKRVICLQAMAIVYGRCHQEIGPFNDTKYIVSLLEASTNKTERDRLIMFLNKLLLNKSNVKDLLDTNGVKVIVDLLTLAHLHTTRATVPLQTNVIESAPDSKRESTPEWYYTDKDKKREGPISFDQMKTLYKEKTITARTQVWAAGMDGWRTLITVGQLKWTLVAQTDGEGNGDAVMNETDLAILLLNMLIGVCRLYPSRNHTNAIVRPIPRIKRMLCDSFCLPHIVQLLLTFDPVIVEKVATLLTEIMCDNAVVSRLYLTGAYFFVLMYTGSNVLPIARFLRETHRLQAFRADEKLDLLQRSILGRMLPAAMVCYLDNYESDLFAEKYLGEFDTPEVIWSIEMRRMMIEKIAGHVADFSPSLQSNTKALYKYCPIALITYPQLENELFCGNYYLRHLCDISKFPDWTIKEPITLLKAILLAWKLEVEKKPSNMSIDVAYRCLGLNVTKTRYPENVIRKAYYKMAQKYHPDKNPNGRDQFEQVNQAYEFLCSKSKVTEGPDPLNIVLILRSQSILFSRYHDDLSPYKYAGYPALITTIRMETKDDQLFSKVAPLLAASAELAYHTVNNSPLNAEELRREGGLELLQEAFSRCVSVLSASSKQEDMAVEVCSHVAQCYSVASQFEACRERIQENPAIIRDLVRILYYRNISRLCVMVTQCVTSFSADSCLQSSLLHNGVLWHLLLFLFHYDYTLEDGGVSKSESTNEQEVSNTLAKMSVRACATLAGYGSVPENQAIQSSLSSMLTPYLARKMSREDPAEVLKLLNSNSENPYLIWDNATRAELMAFLSEQQRSHIRTGQCDQSFGSEFVFSLHAKELIIGDIFVRIYNEQPSFILENSKKFTVELLDFLGSEAEYLHSMKNLPSSSNSSNASMISGNSSPAGKSMASMFNGGSPSSMSASQMNKMGTLIGMATPITRLDSASSSVSSPGGNAFPQPPKKPVKPTKTYQQRLVGVESALNALRYVIKNNNGVEIQCIGHFRLLFSLLMIEKSAKVQRYALEVISLVTSTQECIDDIAASNVLGSLLPLFKQLEDGQILLLNTLSSLCFNTQLLKEAMHKGILIYLLDIFCNSKDPKVREQTAELFSKLLSDKLVGPKIRIIISKFLPIIFMDAMRDNAESSVHMFEGCHENPELVWNDEARKKVSMATTKMSDRFYNSQRKDTQVKWSLPASADGDATVYGSIQGEPMVAGVFLRLFISNPGWVLRRPKDFITELFEKWTQLSSTQQSNNEMLETVTTAIVLFANSQSAMLDQIPQLGYMPRLFKPMTSVTSHNRGNTAAIRSAVQIINQLANNDICVQAISQCPCMQSLKSAMKVRPDVQAIVCETMMRLFRTSDDDLIAQALACNMIEYLMEMLNSSSISASSSDSKSTQTAAKAHIVKSLKSMLNSLKYGEQIQAILNKYPVWAEYRDQRHDLFLNDSSTAGYLQGPATAGYLTASATHKSNNVPPPPSF